MLGVFLQRSTPDRRTHALEWIATALDTLHREEVEGSVTFAEEDTGADDDGYTVVCLDYHQKDGDAYIVSLEGGVDDDYTVLATYRLTPGGEEWGQMLDEWVRRTDGNLSTFSGDVLDWV